MRSQGFVLKEKKFSGGDKNAALLRHVKACNKEAGPYFYGKLYLWRHINNNSISCENELIKQLSVV